ncbi:MAG: hypothetical protein J5729_02110 [Bacteroidaceae bacterium]|nr:hypothetical protein [Bacteroidaceae bacterium]
MKKSLLLSAIMMLAIMPSCQSRVQTDNPQGDQKDSVQTISDEDWAETTFLRYDFTDSSTPPEYHRSFYIGIDKDSIRVCVTCYGDLLRREVFPSSQETLGKAKQALAKLNLRKTPPSNEPPLCGGTSESVAFFKGDEQRAYFAAGEGTLLTSGGSIVMAFGVALPVTVESIIDKTRTPQTVEEPAPKRTSKPKPQLGKSKYIKRRHR